MAGEADTESDQKSSSSFFLSYSSVSTKKTRPSSITIFSADVPSGNYEESIIHSCTGSQKKIYKKKKKYQLAGDLGKTKDASNGGSHIVIEWCVCVC